MLDSCPIVIKRRNLCAAWHKLKLLMFEPFKIETRGTTAFSAYFVPDPIQYHLAQLTSPPQVVSKMGKPKGKRRSVSYDALLMHPCLSTHFL